MARDRDRSQTKKVVLPGGHVIAMAPPTGAERPAARSATERGERQLHVCPECASELVHPVDWEPAASGCWRVELRCPECEWFDSEVHAQGVMDAFDEILDQGTEALLDDLCELSRAIMEEECERFIDALRRDLIVPEDF